jgi:hypothetical protein
MADPLLGVIGAGSSSTRAATSGLTAAMALGPQQDALTSKLHGDLYEAVARKISYHGANQAGQTTTVGLATTYTGLCLSNPNGSGKNVVINRVGYAFIVAFAAGAGVGLMVGYSGTDVTHTTPGSPRSNFIDANYGTAGVAKIDTAATLPATPVVHTLFASGLTGAITTVPHVGPNFIDFEGGIILPPGGFAAIYTSTASGTNGMLASFAWEEVPV